MEGIDQKHCSNCHKELERRSDGRGFKRYPLSQTVGHESSISEVLHKYFDINNLTPLNTRKGRFLCPACFNFVCKGVEFGKAATSFKINQNPDSYIARKRLRTPAKTPRTLKFRKLSDTQVKVCI